MLQLEMDINDVTLFDRPQIRLGTANALIHPFGSFPLEKYITRPLVYGRTGDVTAYAVGDRGALVNHGIWFKYKGIRPRAKARHSSGEPWGGMTRKKAIRELEANQRVNIGFEKYGYKGPLIPAGYLEYDIPFDDDNICCAISKTFGDTRVDEVWNYLYHNPVTESQKLFYGFLKGLNEWAGFSYRVLLEQCIMPSEESTFMENFVFYRVNGGYGISKVDFGSAEFKSNKSLIREYALKLRGWVNSMSYPFNGFEYAKRLGMSTKKVLKNAENIEVMPVKRMSEERIEFDRKRGVKLLYVSNRSFGVMEKMEKRFFQAFDGEIVPEPIDERVVRLIFTGRKLPKWQGKTYW